MKSRTTNSALSVLLLGLILTLAFVGTAVAAEVHSFSKAFGGGELALEGHSGVAINQESGEVYVADTGNSRVTKFTAAGVPDGNLATITAPTFVVVDNSGSGSSGDVYVVDASDNSITKLTAAGAPVNSWGTAGRLGGFGEIAGIAVGPNGNVWVFNTGAIMRQLSPAGSQVSEFNAKIGVTPAGIAINSSEQLFMLRGSALVAKFSAAGVPITPEFGVSTEAIAVDEADQNSYLGNESRIARYNAAEDSVERFGDRAGEEPLSGVSGIAVRKSNSNVYAASPGTDKIQIYTVETVAPPTATIDPPGSIGTTSVQLKGHINPNAAAGNPPSSSVRWEFVCRPGCPGVEGTLAAGNASQIVEGTAQGLTPGIEYEARLVAKNAGSEVAAGPVEFSTPAGPPITEREFAAGIGLTEATFNALIVSNGAPATYHFEYLPESAFLAEGFASSQTKSTAESAPLPADKNPPFETHQASTYNEPHEAAATVAGLAPETPYVFRVVATNTAAKTPGAPTFFSTQATSESGNDCPNNDLRTGFGAFLPDCRAYELVSPVNKGGVGVEGLPNFFNASPDGSRVTFYSQAYTGLAAGGGAHQVYSALLASKNGESWSTQRLLPPETLGNEASFLGTTLDRKYAFVQAGNRPGLGVGLYSIDTVDGSIEPIVPPAQNQVGFNGRNYSVDGSSADGSRVFFETRSQLLPEATAGVVNLYMWNRETGDLSVAGILPGDPEEASPTGSFGGSYRWFEEEQTELGGASSDQYVEAVHAISASGSQIYFTAAETGQLYLRSGLLGGSPTTAHVSAPNAGVVDPNGARPAAFQEATPDGTKAFFTSRQKLTPDATTGPSDEGKDLYRWDASTGTLVDIAPDVTDPNGAEVLGLVGISSDGSAGYFAAKGDLAEGGEAGEHNLYRFVEKPGGEFTVSFVARLGEESIFGDGLNWSPTTFNAGGGVITEFYGRTSRITPNGRILMFQSRRPLTGFNSKGNEELFRYDANGGKLVCISCNPTGEAPKGPAEVTTEFLNAFLTPLGTAPIGEMTRNMTPDGTRIFFQTPDPLAPGDKNSLKKCTYYTELPGGSSHADCLDVYEWEAAGASESCPTAKVNGGCLFLLSTGEGKQTSNFVDASADGSNVFIATASQLVPVDRDTLYDVYDVKVDGGMASQHVVPSESCQSGDACREAAAAPPPTAAPGTASFEGPDNAREKSHQKKCKKGKKHRCKNRKQGHAKGKRAHRGSKAGGSK